MKAREIFAQLRDRERMAIALANRAAEAAGRRLRDYKKPKLLFYEISTNGSWSVFYASRFRSRTTDCFWIQVDAETGATKFLPNKYHFR
jgi:hypothetical protein